MKIILPILIALCLIATKVRSQVPPCTTDTLFHGGNPAGNISWSSGQPVTDQCPLRCDANKFHCWAMPDTTGFNPDTVGRFYLFANETPPEPFCEVRVLTDCNQVRYDSCRQIGPAAAGYPPLIFQLVSNSIQVCVYWDSTQVDSIGVISKPHFDTRVLDSVLFLLDTCGMVAIDEPIPAEQGDGIYRELWPPYRETLEPQRGTLYIRNRKLTTVW